MQDLVKPNMRWESNQKKAAGTCIYIENHFESFEPVIGINDCSEKIEFICEVVPNNFNLFNQKVLYSRFGLANSVPLM